MQQLPSARMYVPWALPPRGDFTHPAKHSIAPANWVGLVVLIGANPVLVLCLLVWLGQQPI